jgi:hypothetical protein
MYTKLNENLYISVKFTCRRRGVTVTGCHMHIIFYTFGKITNLNINKNIVWA